MLNKVKTGIRNIMTFLKNVWEKFNKDKCKLHAAALTFITLLTLIPFLAFLFAISKGLGLPNYIQNIILEKIALGQQEIVLKIIEYIENTKLATLGTLGVIFLFLTVIRLLGGIEEVFNTIWNVKSPRRITRKISDYLTIVILCPLFIFFTLTFTASINSNLFIQKILHISFINYAYFIFLKLLPFISLWLALCIFYMFMPNTKVNFSAGMTAGVIAGTIWQIFNWIYLTFQIGVTKYNAIYGTFSSLPVFMVWIYFSWIVVLIGAELAFVFQNRRKLVLIKSTVTPFLEFKELLSIIRFIVKKFQEGKFPLKEKEILTNTEFDPLKIFKVITYLKNNGILVHKDNEFYFVKNPSEIKLKDIVYPYNEGEKTSGSKSDQILNEAINSNVLSRYVLTDLVE